MTFCHAEACQVGLAWPHAAVITQRSCVSCQGRQSATAMRETGSACRRRCACAQSRRSSRRHAILTRARWWWAAGTARSPCSPAPHSGICDGCLPPTRGPCHVHQHNMLPLARRRIVCFWSAQISRLLLCTHVAAVMPLPNTWHMISMHRRANLFQKQKCMTQGADAAMQSMAALTALLTQEREHKTFQPLQNSFGARTP